MDKLTNKVCELIEKEPMQQLIFASSLYQQISSEVSEALYYKILERMTKRGTLLRLARGIYYRPLCNKFGTVPFGEKEILQHFVSNGKGVVIGYRLYNRLGLTTQVGKNAEAYTNLIEGEEKTVGSVHFRKLNLFLTKEMASVIEVLEVLENYFKIEDLNKEAFGKFMREFCAQYSDEAVQNVLAHIKYKKSTIAFLKCFLDYFGVENTLNKYLSPLSVYRIADMEDFYESARAS